MVVIKPHGTGRFYDEGYQDGFAHGRIHGLIEGRELGREKGFEMWEELGFYEGFALLWRSIHEIQGGKEESVFDSYPIFPGLNLTCPVRQSYLA